MNTFDDDFDFYFDIYDPILSNDISFGHITSDYRVNIDGKSIETMVTDKAAIVTQWVHEIVAIYSGKSKPMVVGMYAESSVSRPKPGTLQLCIDTKCLILKLFHMDEFPGALKDFLLDSNFTFVGIGIASVVVKLKDRFGLECNKTADILELAKLRWPGRFDDFTELKHVAEVWSDRFVDRTELKHVAEVVCGVYMKKPAFCMFLYNWEADFLDLDQVIYACTNAYASYKIGHKLIMEG